MAISPRPGAAAEVDGLHDFYRARRQTCPDGKYLTAPEKAVGLQVYMGMYGRPGRNHVDLGSSFASCTPSDVSCDATATCSGVGTSMRVDCTSCLSAKLMARNYDCGGNLPTSFTASMSGSGVHNYSPTFWTVDASGKFISPVQYTCAPVLARHLYPSWNLVTSCTLQYDPLATQGAWNKRTKPTRAGPVQLLRFRVAALSGSPPIFA